MRLYEKDHIRFYSLMKHIDDELEGIAEEQIPFIFLIAKDAGIEVHSNIHSNEGLTKLLEFSLDAVNDKEPDLSVDIGKDTIN